MNHHRDLKDRSGKFIKKMDGSLIEQPKKVVEEKPKTTKKKVSTKR